MFILLIFSFFYLAFELIYLQVMTSFSKPENKQKNEPFCSPLVDIFGLAKKMIRVAITKESSVKTVPFANKSIEHRQTSGWNHWR